jgi:hypothetical protein
MFSRPSIFFQEPRVAFFASNTGDTQNCGKYCGSDPISSHASHATADGRKAAPVYRRGCLRFTLLFRNNDHNSVFTTSNGDYDTSGLDAYRHWRHPFSFPATC